MADGQKKEDAVIIKKIKKGGHGGAHGGAWKVAFADFMTAMMAFFLVMWLLNMNVSARVQIAQFFREPGVFSWKTGKALPVNLSTSAPTSYSVKADANAVDNFTEKGGQNDNAASQAAPMDSVERESLKKAISDSAQAARNLSEAKKNLESMIIEMSKTDGEIGELLKSVEFKQQPDGVRIELIEDDDARFFESGSSGLTSKGRRIISLMARELGKLPNAIRLEGHTDSRQYGNGKTGFTNWELSSQRALAARSVLAGSGTWAGQIGGVTGYADTKLYNQSNPFDQKNRRVSIFVENLRISDYMNQMKSGTGEQ
jgi:chemotaxis protein MotB